MDNLYDWKIKQLKAMLLAETDEETAGYGANIQHWAGKAKPINIDAKALQALTDHYERRMKDET